MIADKKKVQLFMARACMNANDISKVAQMPAGSVKAVLAGRNVLPRTLGRVARALNCDVAQIIVEEE